MAIFLALEKFKKKTGQKNTKKKQLKSVPRLNILFLETKIS